MRSRWKVIPCSDSRSLMRWTLVLSVFGIGVLAAVMSMGVGMAKARAVRVRMETVGKLCMVVEVDLLWLYGIAHCKLCERL